jgi:unsaturated chondroitin disaccharide hydrolase
MKVRSDLKPSDLSAKLSRMWGLSAAKIRSLEKTSPPGSGAPVFTVKGRYTARGWTEWTQGFQYGSAALQFDATGDREFLDLCRERTLNAMASHITHIGVHDHGFNNVSTYGSLWRLAREGRFDAPAYEGHFYELAIKASGAVQAARWTEIPSENAAVNGGVGGYICSFNGPHSLFVDTIRSLRALALAHKFGHVLMGEKDARISLLGRLIQHAHATAKYAVFYGEGRDSYDVPAARGRTVHESIFNVNDGSFRCPSSQQGYSPFTTWTRGQAWAMLGFAEELEFLATVSDAELEPFGGREAVVAPMLKAAKATCDYWITDTPLDGVPYWDNGAPNIHKLGDTRSKPADPFNPHEPVDSSAAAIACQGLMRLGKYLEGKDAKAREYFQAGLTVLDRLLEEPYLGADMEHQGLLLHSVYHQPNGWDYVAPGQSVPNGEACQWGDYHFREAALMAQRLGEGKPYLTFFGAV